MKYIIYKIFCKDENNDEVYIGLTKNIINRILKHKNRCYNKNDSGYNCTIYKKIRENGGFDNYDYSIIEELDCENINEVKLRERFWIDSNNSKLNKNLPTRTQTEYHNDNIEQIKIQAKIRYNENKEIHKEYYIKNKKYLSEYSKQWNIDNNEYRTKYFKNLRLKKKLEINNISNDNQ
jgi:hypothetical protein